MVSRGLFRRIYISSALILLNTLLLVALINVCLFIVQQFDKGLYQQIEGNPVSREYGDSSLKAAYPDMGFPEIRALLAETWSRPVAYEPFTQFKERPYRGIYVNVSEHGFRKVRDQGPFPPDPGSLNIFVFGGSTTFGYGLPDGQTVPSCLQEILSQRIARRVHVYNFGRGYYYSSQERILFEALLSSGLRPDLAVFVDGLNDFYFHDNEPNFTNRFREVMDGNAAVSREWEFLARLPITRVVKAFQVRLRGIRKQGIRQPADHESRKVVTFDDKKYNSPLVINAVINTYLENKRLIEVVAKAYAIRPVFVWQPISSYQYDLNYHPFIGDGFDAHSYSHYGYMALARRLDDPRLGDDFLWCADIQRGLHDPLYVDKVHYNAKLSKLFAQRIAELLLERGLISSEYRVTN